MTKKDFFRVLIKAFGLFSLITSLFVVFPETMNSVNSYKTYGGAGMELFFMLLYILVVVAFIGFLFVILIRKPDTLIRWLKLDQGFDDDKVQFDGLTPENILKLSSIVIGGLLVIDHFPVFLSYTYSAFSNRVAGAGSGENGSFYIHWATSILDVLLGYVLLKNNDWAGKLLKGDKKKME
jgi:hypothetical protein